MDASWLQVVALGVGATLWMDGWMLLRQRMLGIPRPDYARLGRWLCGLRLGHWVLQPGATPRRAERMLGWLAHYATGVAFAAGLVALGGAAWLRDPTPGLALGVGLATVAAPFLVLQPALGAGLFAHRAPRPAQARLQSIVTHAVFGLGLYASGGALRAFAS